MRILIILFIFTLFSCGKKEKIASKTNSKIFEFQPKILTKIDSIQSEKDAEHLINSLIKDKDRNFVVKKYSDYKNDVIYNYEIPQKIADSLGIDKSFYKADFDGNQLTDLLVIGEYYDFSIYVVMSFENDLLELKKLTQDYNAFVFPRLKNHSIIELYGGFNNDEKLDKKLLTYKFNDFVELNENRIEHQITQIEFETSGCFGTCPVFKLTLLQNKKSEFKALAYNFNDELRINSNDEEGNFLTILRQENWNELIDILNYIDFENLEENYAVNWTDDQTAILKIHYDNGKIKEIRDYGLIGTYGLSILYDKLYEIRKNQDWKKL
ncbi:DUF6438 domain-containing protein [Moheibacter lacus]|uniref:DUF6438 domain-containing protein n=1 Tax=Moheibacter lacus TaxID=2745851 RepID=A0A838ZQP8_9FLAO|nr:DUF6438 domain-containing protein [Moheibacter lacus]MBA5629615.1 hypothetical protein [Moheibacter lacus]